MIKKIDKSVALSAFFKTALMDERGFDEILRVVADDGLYNTVEFCFEGDETQTSAISNSLARYGFKSVFIAALPMKKYVLSLCDADEANRKKAIDKIKCYIDQSYSLGSCKLLLASGRYYGDDKQHASEILQDSLGQLCRYAAMKAEHYVLNITMEYFNDKGEPYFLVGPAMEAGMIARQVLTEHKNFELTFDLSHCIQLGEDPVESFKSISEFVRHIHIANCVIKDPASIFFGDRHPPFGIEGSEVYEKHVQEFLNGIKLAGYFENICENCIIGVEVITPDGMDAMSVYRDASALFERCMRCSFTDWRINKDE